MNEGEHVKYVRAAEVAVVMGSVLVLGTACSGGGAGEPAPVVASGAASPSAEVLPKSSAAVLRVSPANGAKDVRLDGALKVEVDGGTLSEVVVTDKDGKKVAGSTTADGRGWTPEGGLVAGTGYTVSAQAKDGQGLVSAVSSSFTTLVPAGKVSVRDNIGNGETYGVGMIVSVNFGKQVKDKEAVRKAVTVQGSDGTVARGHWLEGDTRLDFRPEDYWKPGTKVTVRHHLKSIEIAPGLYGDKDAEETFTVGEKRISKVDAKTHRMTVTTAAGSREVRISAGSDDNPSWNGKMVIFSKERVTRMNSATVPGVRGEPYDLAAVPHAMKLTDSGTYVHGNSWNPNIGRGNYSHGCVGLFDTESGSKTSDAGKFYEESRIGDVVEIVNSKGETVEPENGLSGWTVPWSKW